MRITEFVTIPNVPAEITPEIQALIDEFGEIYEPAICPKDIVRGPAGTCFDTSAINLIKTNKYGYVEGIATRPSNGQWVAHGWLTDGKHAFDPTWKATDDKTGEEVPLPAEYIGIKLPRDLVLHFMYRTRYQGLLGNKWRWPEPIDTFFELKRLEFSK